MPVILLKCSSVFSYSICYFGKKLLNTKKMTVILKGVFSVSCVTGRSMDHNRGLRGHLLCSTMNSV